MKELLQKIIQVLTQARQNRQTVTAQSAELSKQNNELAEAHRLLDEFLAENDANTYH